MILRTFITVFIFWYASTATGNISFEQVGKTRLTVLFWSVYDIELLTPDGLYVPGRLPLKLKITYLRDFSTRNLVDRTQEEWVEQGISHPESENWLKSLLIIWPNITKGDSLELYVECSGISQFYYNGRLAGSIKDRDFAPAFLAIWLSKETSQPAMRSRLLAGKLAKPTKKHFCR